jgi:hypothetical protein
MFSLLQQYAPIIFRMASKTLWALAPIPCHCLVSPHTTPSLPLLLSLHQCCSSHLMPSPACSFCTPLTPEACISVDLLLCFCPASTPTQLILASSWCPVPGHGFSYMHRCTILTCPRFSWGLGPGLPWCCTEFKKLATFSAEWAEGALPVEHGKSICFLIPPCHCPSWKYLTSTSTYRVRTWHL